jgi:molybdopterin synthase sulfur carrier subunit|tara:strand:- start:71 stop:325 length:255 start_codon:yes stop_codon:yes gene_type:complete
LKITIKYFSWIRVKLKKGSEEFDFEQNTTFKIASKILREKHPIFEEVFNDSSIKFFLNLNEIENQDIALKDGDVIAFLPPVTGG